MAGFGAFVFVLIGTAGRAEAQSFELGDANWEGMKGLVDLARKELGDGRVEASNHLDWSTLGPSDGLLVLHPETLLDGDELAAFLRNGGRAAVVDDFALGDKILARYQIKRVPTPSQPLYSLRNNPSLALAEPVSETVAGRKGGVHPVVAEVARLVTNHPSGLLHPDLSTVLRIRATGEADVALAVAGQVGKGRLFAMGDPSAIINLMLRYPGNRAFALGLVRYLVDDDTWGTRQGRLVIVSNRFEESGTSTDSAGTKELKEWMRTLRAEVQRVGGDGLPKGVTMALSVGAVFALLLFLAQIAARVYRHPTPRYARGVPLLAQGGAAGRAAVLAAPTTHRGLLLLEQRDALEEEMGVLLGLNQPATAANLLEEITRRGLLDPPTFDELKKMFFEISTVETSVGAGVPVRVSTAQLLRIERSGQRVLAALADRMRRVEARGG